MKFHLLIDMLDPMYDYYDSSGAEKLCLTLTGNLKGCSVFFLFQQMETTREKVLSHTKRGQLVASRDLISELMLSSLSREEQISLLEGQVGVAKKQRQTQWLKGVATEADSLAFHEPGWIDSHIYRLHRPAKKASQDPTETRDIRLKDPSFPHKVEMTSTRDESSLSMKQLEEMLPEPSKGAESVPESMEVSGPVPGISQDVVAADKGVEPSGPVLEVRDKTPPKAAHPDESSLRRSPRKSQAHKGHESPRRRSPRKHKSTRPDKGETSRQSTRHSPRRDRPQERRHSPRRGQRAKSPEHRRQERVRYRQRSPEKRKREEVSRARGSHDEGKRQRVDRPGPSSAYTERPSTRQPTAPHHRPQPKQANECPVPGCGGIVSRQHAFEAHVPEIFDETQTLTEEVTRRRACALRVCCMSIIGRLDLQELAKYISEVCALRRGELSVNRAYQASMTDLCNVQEWEVPDTFDLVVPYSPCALIHWRLLLAVVASMPTREARNLRQSYPAVEPPDVQNLPQGFDAHFHLDRTAKRAKKSQLRQVIDSIKPPDEYRVHIAGGIVVYCDPESYPSEEAVAELATQGFGVAIGLHPKTMRPYTEADWEAFRRCLTYPGVKALGEVGIDYSAEAHKWAAQHEILDRAVQSLSPEHVLVLHNRAPLGRPDSEMVQILYQLKGVVPREQRIHLHCFLGTSETVDLWLREFPNTHFGYTGDRIDRATAEEKEALKSLAADRILLETDAPYFSMNRPFSSPALLGMVAKKVADIRNQDWIEVLQVAGHNVRQLYKV